MEHTERDYYGDVLYVYHDQGNLQAKVVINGVGCWYINLDRCSTLPTAHESVEVVRDAGRNRILEIWIGGRRYQ